MESKDRITVREDIEIILSQIYDIALRVKYQTMNSNNNIVCLVNRLDEDIEKIRENISELSNPFLLFIIGSGKYGKSTLINTLIKGDYATTNDLPATWKIDSFIKSKKEEVTIIDKNLNEIKMSIKKAKSLFKEEERKRKESEKYINNEVNNLKKCGEKNINKLKEYKEKLKKEKLYISDIIETRYQVNKSDSILDDFIIVDTPGLNQNLLGNTKKRIDEYYKRADGVIWILDCQNIVSKASYELINDINSNYINNSKSNIIAVINKMDIIKDNYGVEKLNEVNAVAQNIYKNYFLDIIPISAKNAHKGIIDKDEKLIKESNIEQLLKSIEINFKKKCEEIQIESKLRNFDIFRNKVIKDINEYKRKLYEDMMKYDRAKNELNEELEKIREDLINKAKIFYDKDLNNLDIKRNEFKDNIEKFQNHINDELDRIYKKLCALSNLEKNQTIKPMDLNINILNSKYVLLRYKNIQNTPIKEKNMLLNMYEKLIKYEESKNNQDNYNLKRTNSKIYNELITNIDEKINSIRNEVDVLREISFESAYTEYKEIKKHICLLDEIVSILKF